jgi:hypothetical protein
MMAIAITGIIIGPIGGAVFLGLRTADETSNRYASSNDAQTLSVWLPPDVQSAGNQVGDVVTSGNTECSGVTNVLRLKWRETQGSTTNTYVAAYATGLNANTGIYRLTRYYCVNGGAATTHVVARNLANATAATATVSTTKVAMAVTSRGTPTDPTGYAYTVSGYRRTP